VEITGLVGTLRRWWGTLIVAGIVAALGAWILASRAPETFEASTRLVVGPLAGNTDTVRAAGTLARTDAEVAQSQSLLDDAARALGLPPEEVDDVDVDASANEVTRLLVISVRDDDPARAADLANELATALGARVKEDPVGPEGTIVVLDAAEVPSEPAEPNVPRIVTLSVLATLVLAFGVAWLLDRFDDAVARPDELEEAVPAAFVIAVPPWRRGRGSPTALLARPGSPAGAALRLTATSLELAVEKPPRTVLVTGTETGEASEDVAANLAALLATPRRRVLLVDATTEGRLRGLLGLQTDVPRGLGGPEVVVDQVDTGSGASFDVLAEDVGGGGAGLALDEARIVLDELGAAADWIIVHTEPMSSAAATLVWASTCSATVLVVQQGRTRREAVAGSADAIARVGGTVAGVVLNERRPAERFRRRRDRKRRRRRTRRSRKKAEPQVRVLPRGQTPDAARPSAVESATEPFARP
jgi:capsular polysaccharide biosynthesis protein/Mrp family chromosome partitioning ATPase